MTSPLRFFASSTIVCGPGETPSRFTTFFSSRIVPLSVSSMKTSTSGCGIELLSCLMSLSAGISVSTMT